MRYKWEYSLVAVMLLVMITTFWFSKVVLGI
uniref:Uncharacterized protein n=1 Tax=Siphoviridae sp. ctGa111 TaxID=2825413 RepID=A0A8S5VDP3_9CAUD|nr:MAG TPA: hypothetical protein [Siphoviridae sp. ctGa111]